jgi:hypothetical protein
VAKGAPRSLVQTCGDAAAKLPFKAHPHMLRQACGFALANVDGSEEQLVDDLGGRRGSPRFSSVTISALAFFPLSLLRRAAETDLIVAAH